LSIGTASSSVSRIVIFYSNIRWSIVYWFVPAALPAVCLGAWLLTYVNPMYLEFLLGIFLLSNIPLLFKTKKNETVTAVKSPKTLLLGVGFAAGFVSGLTGAVGLLFNRFYLRYGLNKEEIVATRATNELLLHLIKVALYASFGLMTGKVITYGFLIALAAIISSVLVGKVLPYISENIFQKIGYSAMVLSGIIMVMNASLNFKNENQVQLSYKEEEEGLETKMKWRQSTFEMELEFEDGFFEIEYEINFHDLPEDKQMTVKGLTAGADKVELEEVYGINKHFYEVYVYKNGKLSKYEI
jgi:uncharacterized membrane protein YfcA